MLFSELVAVSGAVAATRSRLEKRRLLAGALRSASADEAEVVATYLSGRVRQRRTGVGWRGLADLPAPAAAPSLTPLEIDATLERLSLLAGSGSQGERAREVTALFARATGAEQDALRGLITGELRQGGTRLPAAGRRRRGCRRAGRTGAAGRDVLGADRSRRGRGAPGRR